MDANALDGIHTPSGVNIQRSGSFRMSRSSLDTSDHCTEIARTSSCTYTAHLLFVSQRQLSNHRYRYIVPAHGSFEYLLQHCKGILYLTTLPWLVPLSHRWNRHHHSSGAQRIVLICASIEKKLFDLFIWLRPRTIAHAARTKLHLYEFATERFIIVGLAFHGAPPLNQKCCSCTTTYFFFFSDFLKFILCSQYSYWSLPAWFSHGDYLRQRLCARVFSAIEPSYSGLKFPSSSLHRFLLSK